MAAEPKPEVPARAVRHMGIINANDEWETPPELFREICKVAGFVPKLDVAATERSALCGEYLTREDDALRREWTAPWWANPPYSKVGEFVRHAAGQAQKHGVPGILLTYAKTDTAWFHNYVWKRPGMEVHFIRGRVKFWTGGRPGPSAAPYPSMYVVIRPPTGTVKENRERKTQ